MANFAYVCDQSTPALQILNLSTFSQVSVTVGTSPQYCAQRPDLSEVWVTNKTSNTVSVVNLTSNTVTHTITGFNAPEQIGFSNDGTMAYVANSGTNTILPITVSTYAVGSALTTPGGFYNYFAMNLTSNSLVASTKISGGATGAQAVTLPGGGLSGVLNFGTGTTSYLCLSTNGTYGYRTDSLTPSVGVFNPATMTLISTLTPPGSNAVYSAVSTADSTKIYVGGPGTTYIINTSTNTFSGTTLATGGAGTENAGITITADGTQLVVTNILSGNTYLFALPGNTLTHTFSTGSPFGCCSTVNQVTPVVPVVTPHRTALFVPRKGLRHWDLSDLEINWNAIERWASGQSYPIIFPSRGMRRMPTERELDANWNRLQIWAASSGIPTPPNGSTAPLLIQRKNSLDTDDLNINFLRIQDWANGQ